MISLKEVKKNPKVLEFLRQTRQVLKDYNYTDHGQNHSELVSARARTVAKEIGLNSHDQELAAIAGFVHDFANFLSRTYHNYLGALLFQQIFGKDSSAGSSQAFSPEELSLIMKAIADHDKQQLKFSNPISAILVLADKSDVRRSRVIIKDMTIIRKDIHNRVNFAVRAGKLGIDKRKKRITLSLKIDTNFVPVMEYFEIFTDRMVLCREAAKYLGYKFGLVINNFKLL